MEEKRPLDIQTLGRWLEKNKVSRTELASSLGLARSTIDNYFSKGSIPKHVQILISRYMKGREPASNNDFVSQLREVLIGHRTGLAYLFHNHSPNGIRTFL